MPESNLIDRYQAHRTRRFLQNEETFRHWLPNWRTRRRRRVLVVALAVLFTTMVAVSTACLFNPLFAVAWPVLTLLFLPTWSSLQIVSGRQGDAPRQALDEWEIQQRNDASLRRAQRDPNVGLHCRHFPHFHLVGAVECREAALHGRFIGTDCNADRRVHARDDSLVDQSRPGSD